jgi:hypothetical protein
MVVLLLLYKIDFEKENRDATIGGGLEDGLSKYPKTFHAEFGEKLVRSYCGYKRIPIHSAGYNIKRAALTQQQYNMVSLHLF